RVVIQRLLPDFFLDRILPSILWRQIPFIQPLKIPAYDQITNGEMNTLGLRDAGVTYVKALRAKGMLIDLAHMSQQSVTDTYNAVEVPTEAGQSGCGNLASITMPAEDCYYPLTASHIHFRAQSLQPNQTTFAPFLPR